MDRFKLTRSLVSELHWHNFLHVLQNDWGGKIETTKLRLQFEKAGGPIWFFVSFLQMKIKSISETEGDWGLLLERQVAQIWIGNSYHRGLCPDHRWRHRVTLRILKRLHWSGDFWRKTDFGLQFLNFWLMFIIHI